MKFRNLVAALSLCAALSPAMAAESGREPPEVLASLDPIFEKFMSDNHVPGLVFGVVTDGKLAYVRAFGVQDTSTNTAVTPDTVFRIASMSKNFSALAALKLRDAGKLAFDAPAERYIPELAKLEYPTSDSPKIMVRDLLSHGAGFVTDDPWGDRQLDMSESDFSKFMVSGIPFSRAPGMAYEYSNFGYALVGRLITNISRRNYAEYIEAQFLQPLGMRATTYDIAKIPRARRATGYRWEKESWREEPALGPGTFGAMGGLATSANDYARYVSWVLSAWPPRDGAEDPILRRSSVREIARPQNFATLIPAADPAGCARSAAYALGENSQNDCVLGFHFGHSGGLPGYGSNVLFIPGRNLAVFAFANRTYTPASRAVREAANQLGQLRAVPGARALTESRLAVDAFRVPGHLRQCRRRALPGRAGDELPHGSQRRAAQCRDCRAQGEVRRMPHRAAHHHRQRTFRIVRLQLRTGQAQNRADSRAHQARHDSEARIRAREVRALEAAALSSRIGS